MRRTKLDQSLWSATGSNILARGLLGRGLSLTLMAMALLAPRSASAKNLNVKVVEVVGEVELIPGGDESRATLLAGGEVIGASDRIFTGMESQARLQFADNSTVVVRELTDMKVGEFRDDGRVVRTQLWLRGGEVSAQVNKRKVRSSNFTIRNPTATAGVRGTVLTMLSTHTRNFVGLARGAGFGRDNTGSEVTVEPDQDTETDAKGKIKTPGQKKRNDAQTDARSDGQTEDEEIAADENATLSDVLQTGFLGSGGEAPVGDSVQTANVVATSQQMADPNLITNGGFENGISPWQLSNPNSHSGVFSNPGGLTHPGTGNFGLIATNQDSGSLPGGLAAFQEFDIPEPGNYTLSYGFTLANQSSSNSVSAQVFVFDPMNQQVFFDLESLPPGVSPVLSPPPVPSPLSPFTSQVSGQESEAFNTGMAGTHKVKFAVFSSADAGVAGLLDNVSVVPGGTPDS